MRLILLLVAAIFMFLAAFHVHAHDVSFFALAWAFVILAFALEGLVGMLPGRQQPPQ